MVFLEVETAAISPLALQKKENVGGEELSVVTAPLHLFSTGLYSVARSWAKDACRSGADHLRDLFVPHEIYFGLRMISGRACARR